MMRSRGSAAAIIVLALVLGAGCNGWRGFGFRASGSEMPRLRHELALEPGPGGVLAIIGFPPMFSWRWPWSPKAPPGRIGHGVAASLVVEDVTASGFRLVNVIEDWTGRGPLKSYCAIFRKPETRP